MKIGIKKDIKNYYFYFVYVLYICIMCIYKVSIDF